jgi:hypothetical protein
MSKQEIDPMTRNQKRYVYNNSFKSVLLKSEELCDLATKAGAPKEQVEKLYKSIKSDLAAVNAFKDGEEKIYVIERIDFELPNNVTFTPEGFTETEEAAIELCKQLEKRFEKRLDKYEINGEEGFYPRFGVNEVRRHLLDK